MSGRLRGLRRVELYEGGGEPIADFNEHVVSWLQGTEQLREHKRPAAFETLRLAYQAQLAGAARRVEDARDQRWRAHRAILSNLTELMLGSDIGAELAARLDPGTINPGGFRTTLSQGIAKNTGENFTNAIAYGLADALKWQDEVLVDKGLPPHLRQLLTVRRVSGGRAWGNSPIAFTIEADLCVFSRSDSARAILISSKTRLKEVFHIGTMWALLLRMIGDEYCCKKWGLTCSPDAVDRGIGKIAYVFATADMISKGGRRTQGRDIDREGGARNLIRMDASFFDYVFVSIAGVPHVSAELDLGRGRESLFHELGCILDLTKQFFGLSW